MKKYKILFTDLDDTLIKTYTNKTFAQGVWDMMFKFEVFRKIKELEPEYLFIVTNQGGIGKFITDENFNKKLDYVECSLKDFIRHGKLIAVDSMYCPTNDKTDEFRKPNPGMVNFFIEKYKLLENGYTKDDMLMIGDASGNPGNFSDSDKKTAENAGINYLDINDFIRMSFI